MSDNVSTTSSTSTLAGATENNHRLFSRFQKAFQENNPPEFIQFAEKLTKWLSDRKAYYEAARPEIVKLLFVAESTLRRTLGVPVDLKVPFNIYNHPAHPLIAPYVLMIETVLRFEDCFEPSLRVYIKQLRSNITLPGSVPSSSPLNQRFPSGGQTSEPLKTMDQTFNDPDIQVIERPQPSSSVSAPPPLAQPGPMSSTNTGASASVITRRVKKKKKTLDFDALAQADIDELIQKKKALSTNKVLVKAEPLAISPRVPPAAHMQSFGNSVHSPIDLTEPEHPEEMTQKLKVAAVSGSLPSAPVPSMLSVSPAPSQKPPITQSIPVETTSGALANRSDATRLTPVETPKPLPQDMSMEIDGNERHTAATTPGATAAIAQEKGASIAEPRSLDTASPAKANINEISTTPSNAQAPETLVQINSAPGAIPMDVDNPPESLHVHPRGKGTAETLMEIDSDQPAIKNVIPPTIENSLPMPNKELLAAIPQAISTVPASIKSAPITSSSSMSLSPVESTSVSSKSATRKDVLSSGAKTARSSEERRKKSADRSVNPAIIHSTIEKNINAMSTAADRPSDVFAGSSMRVIAILQGPPKGSRITINFDIEAEQFNGIAIWGSQHGGQKPKLEDLENSSICISLGCYATDQLPEQGIANHFELFEKRLPSLHSIWPTGGQVSIYVMFDGKREKLPLAPPFKVTPDNFVDISQFATEGVNDIHLSTKCDLKQYTFVLFVHNPTRSQLTQVREQRQRDNEWAEWLTEISKPFNVHVRPPTGSL